MNRKYKSKSIVMLTASATAAEHFDENKAVFVEERPQWADPYSSQFKIRIDGALSKYLGVKSHGQVKDATAVLKQIQGKAKDDLAMVKTQIERDFKNDVIRRDALLHTLGYVTFWKKAGNNNQSALIELLFAFQNNLSVEIRTELTDKGVNDTRITAILEYASSLQKANISQETLKGSSKLLTEEAITEFNAIYDQAMDICALGQKLFKNDKTRKELFNYSALVRAQIAAGVGGDDTEPEAAKGDTGNAK